MAFTVSMVRLRMARGFRIKLAESFQVIHWQLVTQEMEKNVLKGASRLETKSLP